MTVPRGVPEPMLATLGPAPRATTSTATLPQVPRPSGSANPNSPTNLSLGARPPTRPPGTGGRAPFFFGKCPAAGTPAATRPAWRAKNRTHHQFSVSRPPIIAVREPVTARAGAA